MLEKVSRDAYNDFRRANRPLLREIIYSDIAKKKTLEGILHPAIRERWSSRAKEPSERLFVVDIPLLFETRSESLFDHVVVVASSERTQIRRMVEQRSLSEDLARKILASQWSLHVKMRGATHVVWNDSGPSLLESQADLFAAYLRNLYD